MKKISAIHSNLIELAKIDPNLSTQLDLKNERYFISHVGEILKSDTYHAHERKKERGINNFMVEIAIYYGRKEELRRKNKNPLIKFKIYKKDLKRTVFAKYSDVLDGLVVITLKSNPNILITTFFHNFIVDNSRTRSEESYYRKESNKAYKRLKNNLKGEIEDYG